MIMLVPQLGNNPLLKPMKCGSAVGAAVAGSMISGIFSTAASESNSSNVAATNQSNLKIWREQREYDYQKWKEGLEYDKPVNQVQRLQDAGLNPSLMLSNIGTGTTTSYAGGQTPPTLESPQVAPNQFARLGAPFEKILEYMNQAETNKGQALDNLYKLSSMKDRLDSLRLDKDAKQMNNDMFQAMMEDNIQIVHQQNLNARLDNDIKALTAVGSRYQVGMQRFSLFNLAPLQLQTLEAGLARSAAEINMMKSKEALNYKEIDSLTNSIALGWARLSLDWYSAKSQHGVNNSVVRLNDANAFSTKQNTFRENFKFNEVKGLFYKQIKLGVDQLQLDNEIRGQQFDDSHSWFNYVWRKTGISGNDVYNSFTPMLNSPEEVTTSNVTTYKNNRKVSQQRSTTTKKRKTKFRFKK